MVGVIESSLSSMISAMRDSQSGTTSLTQLDSHATSLIVGCNCVVVHDTGQTGSVWGFTKELKQLTGIPIVDAIVAYDCPYSQHTIMIVVHNAYLSCTFQAR